jgi:hypothetical protein
VTVQIGMPRQSGDAWVCPFEITGLGSAKVAHGCGEDAVQALILALASIRAARDRSSPPLTWLSGDAGDTGFPRFVPDAFGIDFSRRIERLIDRETDRFGAALEARHSRKSRGTPTSDPAAREGRRRAGRVRPAKP